MMNEDVQVSELKEALERGDGQLLDVREYAEFAAAHIRGARLIPLRELDERCAELDRTRPLYVICRTGRRARQAQNLLRARGFSDVRCVAGGMLSWQERGYDVESEAGAPWSLERQVRFAAGALVLVGTLASLFVAQPFIWLAIFIGAGLVFSAITDTCGMAMLLARMPWNRARGEASCRAGSERQWVR